MYAYGLKNLVSHVHMPHLHGLTSRLQELFRDEKFWLAVLAITVAAVLILLALGQRGGSAPESINLEPLLYYR